MSKHRPESDAFVMGALWSITKGSTDVYTLAKWAREESLRLWPDFPEPTPEEIAASKGRKVSYD